MPSIAQQLVTKNYWRMLFRSATWREAWFSLRRVHKDKRARKHLSWLLRFTLPPLIYLGFLCLSGFILFALPAVLIFGWLGRKARREAARANSPSPLTIKQRTEVRTFFSELALIYAVLADRSASEAFLKEKILPDHIQIISRRVHIDLLKSNNLWNKLLPVERDALMIADGHWEWPMINNASFSRERVRLLRWILRIDYHLPLLGTQLQYDAQIFKDIISSPSIAFDGEEMILPSTVESARKAGHDFFVRCLAEEIVRGFHGPEQVESSPWAQEISAAMSGKQSEDLILGDKLVSEAPLELVHYAATLARTRSEFLAWAGKILDGSLPPTRFDSSNNQAPSESTGAAREPFVEKQSVG